MAVLGAGSAQALQAPGTVLGETKVGSGSGGFAGALLDGDLFGRATTVIGDLDGDGLSELAVGAPRDDDGGFNAGAVWVLFLDASGGVRAEQKVSNTAGGFGGRIVQHDHFGTSLAGLGDLSGDGTLELAVGSEWDDTGGQNDGAVWLLSLDAAGRVMSERRLGEGSGGFVGPLDGNDRFGRAVASPGDLDGDGVNDLVVGADGDDDGGSDCGALWILFLAPDGSVQRERKVSALTGGFTGALGAGARFGVSVASLGDLDGDGVPDLAVGADGAAGAGLLSGVVWILFLAPDGSVQASTSLDASHGFGLGSRDGFGLSVVVPGDLDGDGLPELAIGAPGDDDGGSSAGAVWLAFLDNAGGVRGTGKISALAGGLVGPLSWNDRFGYGLAAPGDLDGDGRADLVVGADGDDTGGSDRGALWVLQLDGASASPANRPPTVTCSARSTVELGVGPVMLMGHAADPDGDPLSYRWTYLERRVAGGAVHTDPSGQEVPLPMHTVSLEGDLELGVGEHVFEVTVEDGVHAPVSATTRVVVVDSRPPELALVSDTTVLWPPNGRMVPVRVEIFVSDASGGLPALDAQVRVEGEDRRRPCSFTAPVIAGEPPVLEVELEARRPGRQSGGELVYTIEVRAVDASGNEARASLDVVVPHDGASGAVSESRHGDHGERGRRGR